MIFVFTIGSLWWPSQNPINRDTGYSNVLDSLLFPAQFSWCSQMGEAPMQIKLWPTLEILDSYRNNWSFGLLVLICKQHKLEKTKDFVSSEFEFERMRSVREYCLGISQGNGFSLLAKAYLHRGTRKSGRKQERYTIEINWVPRRRSTDPRPTVQPQARDIWDYLQHLQQRRLETIEIECARKSCRNSQGVRGDSGKFSK